jgi:outer membrane protein assembly factor BamB
MPAIETTLSVLDEKTGEKLWSAPLTAPARPEQGTRTASWERIFHDNALKPTLHYQPARNLVLAIVDRHRFHAFDATSGSPLWTRSTQARLSDLVGFEPPTLTRDLIVCDDGTLLDPVTGKPAAGFSQVGGRGVGCNRYVGSDALVTFRSASACYLDLTTKERSYFSSTRSGCTNNMIPAAGLLSVQLSLPHQLRHVSPP